MFVGFNSGTSESGPRTLAMLGPAFGWDGAAELVARSPRDSERGSESLQVASSGLVQADGVPFAPVGSQLVFAQGPGFPRRGSWLMGDDVLINDMGAHWKKLDSVNVYVCQVEHQLVSLHSDLSKLNVLLGTVSIPDYYSESWTEEFEGLYSQAVDIGVANSRLRRARWMAAGNSARACRFLASEIRVAITEKIAHLRRRLRVAKSLRSKLLRLFASVYEFRNQIVLQRRYYLAHGSHPIENSICQETRRSLDQRGCVPAFLQ